MGGREVFGLRFFRSKTSDIGNFSRVQNVVKLIFENISVFLGGFFTTTERRGRHEIEQSQIGPKGEGVGTSESKKGRTRRQRRVWKAESKSRAEAQGRRGGVEVKAGEFESRVLTRLRSPEVGADR